MRRHILLGLSLYWRLLVVSTLTSAAIVLSLLSAQALSEPTYMKLKPTLLFALSGSIWLASLLATPNGIAYLVWGRRLKLSSQFWRSFTVAIGTLFFALAALNLLVAFLLPLESWLQFKLFVPSLAMLAASFGCAVALAGKSQPTGGSPG